MSPTEQMIVKNLASALDGVCMLAEMVCNPSQIGEISRVEMLDRLNSGLQSGKITINVDPSIVGNNGELLYEPRE
jgi:hypothetical protein